MRQYRYEGRIKKKKKKHTCVYMYKPRTPRAGFKRDTMRESFPGRKCFIDTEQNAGKRF